MNEQEQAIAEQLYQAIQDHSNSTERSLQAKEFRVGPSDIGFCSEKTRRMLDQQTPEDDEDVLKAFIGTAIGEKVEEAALLVWPQAIIQSEVEVTIKGERREFTLTGHPDIVLPEGIVLDNKTVFGLDNIERTGPSDSQQFQRNIYALGAFQAGMFNEGVSLDDVQVGNVWLDRGGVDKRLHVQLEPYSQETVDRAGMWLDDVVYAYLNGEEARKEPPREMCAATCGFYRTCRAYDTDVEGLLTEPSVLAAVDMHVQGGLLMRDGIRLRDQAKVELDGISGSTGDYTVRWTYINPTVVPESSRKGYSKLEVKRIPKARRVMGK